MFDDKKLDSRWIEFYVGFILISLILFLFSSNYKNTNKQTKRNIKGNICLYKTRKEMYDSCFLVFTSVFRFTWFERKETGSNKLLEHLSTW